VRNALVTGAAGLLGQHIVNQLRTEFSVTGVDIAPSPFPAASITSYIRADLSGPGTIEHILAACKPELVFNCAAYTDVDGCEKKRDLAYRLNVGLVDGLLCARQSTIVHFSTDYVFDGQSGPYSEEDPTNPLGYYGVTKLLSEEKLEKSDKALIIRSNVLFGTATGARPNFITWLIESLRAGKNLSIVTDQFNNPIHAGHLAEASIEAATMGLRGIWHIAGKDYISRHEIAMRVAAFFKLDENLIKPITTAQLGQTAHRPLRGGLKIDKAAGSLRMALPSFEDGLRLMAAY
jgi:dTDP-4-dehydrorhamnose reductase